RSTATVTALSVARSVTSAGRSTSRRVNSRSIRQRLSSHPRHAPIPDTGVAAWKSSTAASKLQAPVSIDSTYPITRLPNYQINQLPNPLSRMFDERAVPELRERRPQFFLRVHDDWTVPRDGLFDRST